MRKAISIVVLAAFIVTSVKSPAYAQLSDDQIPRLPQPGVMVHLSPKFSPAQLQGITIHPDNALRFDFLIRKGDQELEGVQKKEEYKKLVKYFLASLTIPDDNQWVNLSPYENNRIIKDDFGKTEMGRDLLAEDYMLKQITSSLIYPEDGLGKKFWDKVYQRAWNEYHTTNVPVNTFNKVWIVPDQAIVYESGNTAFILQSHLKVMLEEDYLSLQKHTVIQKNPVIQNDSHFIASQVIRQIILPELEKEVNEGKNFANLRQMYSGMILATWYKKALKDSLLGKIYADKDKVKGVDQDPKNNEVIYQQYLKAFKKGVFNFIKDDVDKYTNEAIPRKYFSGGYFNRDGNVIRVVHDLAMLPEETRHAISADVFDAAMVDEATVDLQGTEEAAMLTELGTDLSFRLDTALYLMQKEPGNIADMHEAEQILSNVENQIGGVEFLDRLVINKRLKNLKELFKNKFGHEIGTGRSRRLFQRDEAMASPLSLKIRRYRQRIIPLIKQLVELDLGELISNSYGVVTFEFTSTIDTETKRTLVSRVEEIFRLSDPQGNFNTTAEFDGNKFIVKIALPPRIDESLESIGIPNEVIRKISNRTRIKSLRVQDILDYYSSWKELFVVGEKRLSPNRASEVIRVLRANGLQLPGDPFPLLGEDISKMKLEDIGRIFREQFGDSIPSVLNWSSGDISKLRDNFNIITLGNLIGRKWPVTVDTLLEDKINWFSKTYLPRPNRAMLTDSGRVNKVQPEAFPGGIDFNSANLAMVIKHDGKGVPLPLAQQDMAQLGRIRGFEPEIIDIEPAVDVPVLSELKQKLQVS